MIECTIERHLVKLLLSLAVAVPLLAQTTPTPTPTHANILRGEYGRYRANNDLLSYRLDIRVDPDQKSVSGKNTIRFKMLRDDTRIQLDLYDNLSVDKIVLVGPKSNVQSPKSKVRDRIQPVEGREQGRNAEV